MYCSAVLPPQACQGAITAVSTPEFTSCSHRCCGSWVTVPVRALLCVICGRYTPPLSGSTLVPAVSLHSVRSLMVSLTLMVLPVPVITLSFKIYMPEIHSNTGSWRKYPHVTLTLNLLAPNTVGAHINLQTTNVIYIYMYVYMEHLFLMFLDHTQRRTTVCRAPLDEWSARRRDLYQTTHNTHNRQ